MKKLFVLLVAVAAAILLVSCGETLPNLDVAELEVPEVPEGLVQGVDGNTVKVGNTASKTGGFAAVGIPFSAAIAATIDNYNSNPNSKWNVEYITYDDGSDANTGLTNTRRLIETDQIFAFVGHLGTGTVGGTLPTILEAHVPLVYAATGINTLYWENSPGNPIMTVQPIYKTDGRIAYARAISEELFGENGNERLPDSAKVGVLYSNDDAGRSIAAGIIAEARTQQLEGNLIVMSFEETTVESVVRSMVSRNADVIIVAGNQQPLANVLVNLNDLGSTVPVFTSYVNTDASTITNQDYSFNLYGSAWIDPLTTEGYASYLQYYTIISAAGYGADNPTENYTQNAYAMAGFVAAKVFLEGLERVEVGELTFKTFISAMESAPIPVPMGGEIDYSDGRRWGITSMSLVQYTRAQDTDGVYQASFSKIREIESLEEILAKRG